MGWVEDKFATLADPSDVPLTMAVGDTLGKSNKHLQLPDYSIPEKVIFALEVLEKDLADASLDHQKKTGRQLDLTTVDVSGIAEFGDGLSGEAQTNSMFLKATLSMLAKGVTPDTFRQRFAFLLYAMEAQLKEELESYEMSSARVFSDEDLAGRGLFGIVIPGLKDGDPQLVVKDPVFLR